MRCPSNPRRFATEGVSLVADARSPPVTESIGEEKEEVGAQIWCSNDGTLRDWEERRKLPLAPVSLLSLATLKPSLSSWARPRSDKSWSLRRLVNPSNFNNLL
jgi:hypothetical protein